MARAAKLALLAIASFVAFAADKDPRIVQELLFGTAFNIGLWFIARRFWPVLKSVELNIETAALLIFALGSTIQAMGTHIATEIPRLKLLLRSIYYLYLFFCLSPYRSRLGSAASALFALFLFTSLPFHWSTIVGSSRNLLPAVFMLYTLVSRFEERAWTSKIVSLIPASIALCALFAVSQAANHNLYDGMDSLARLFTGLAVVLLVQSWNEKESHVLAAGIGLLILNLGFLAMAAAFTLGGEMTLGEKRFSLGGLNTNDIAGYLITVSPTVLLALLHERSARYRMICAAALAGLILFMLLARARLAWPTLLAIVAWLIFTLRFRVQAAPRRALLIAGVLIVLVGSAAVFFITSFPLEKVSFEVTTLQYRTALIKQAGLVILERPLTGIGAGNYAGLASFAPSEHNTMFTRFVRDDGGLVHVHNMLAQLSLDAGLWFGLVFLALILRALQVLFTTPAGLKQWAPVALVAVYLQGLLNFHFEVYHVWLLFCVASGLVLPEKWSLLPERAAVPLMISAVTILVALLAYHSIGVYSEGNALRSVKNNRYKNALGALVIQSDGQKVAVKPDLTSFERTALMYPGDRRLTQQAAEAQLAVYDSTGDERAINRAQELYESCGRLRLNGAFCLDRRATIARLKGENETAIQGYLRARDAADPSDLVNRKLLLSF